MTQLFIVYDEVDNTKWKTVFFSEKRILVKIMCKTLHGPFGLKQIGLKNELTHE